MVEQTVFTDSDREGVCYRVYTVGSGEFNVFTCMRFFAFVFLSPYSSLCQSVGISAVCTVKCVFFWVRLHAEAVSISVLSAQAPLPFFPRFSSACTLPLSSNPLPVALCNGQRQINPSRTSHLDWGHRTHLFPPLSLPISVSVTLYLTLLKKKKSVRPCAHLCEVVNMCLHAMYIHEDIGYRIFTDL